MTAAAPAVAFRLPEALDTPNDDQALGLLASYFGHLDGTGDQFIGATFDGWDSTGTRADDADRFAADDLIAIGFLSVTVPATTARTLLRDRADELAALLAQVGPDRDLADEVDPVTPAWPAWQLYDALDSILWIGRTTATKLLARKRPRLLPVWDQYIGQVTGCTGEHWEPLRQALRADERALHRRLLRLRDTAGLPRGVSPLRVLDVICWLEGKAAAKPPPLHRRRLARRRV
ncbi:DUF6308 family protein [Micromonospora echinospora]